MSTVKSLSAVIDQRLRAAIAAALPPEAADADPQVRKSEHADFQIDGILPLARPLRSNPRAIATQVVEALPADDLIAAREVSGPGFINLTIADTAIWRQVIDRLADERCGVGADQTGNTTVIDYSQPNIAKEMHVGHLRSTIIGDALARTLGFLGSDVVRQNHLGDWGTQFGMLIQYLFEHPEDRHSDEDESGSTAMSRLNTLYRTARAVFDSDAEFAERARRRVVELQAGDADTLAVWQELVDESKIYFNEVYGRLDVLLTDEDAVGESFYNPHLREVAEDLESRGVAVRSDGALCVFFDDVKGPDGNLVPLIVQKSDGGFGYAATDLTAIRYRVSQLGANRILYVVDSRQALHFKMVFETARRAGYLPADVEAVHVSFGSVLGPDGKPFKTRSGDTVQLISLLNAAVDKARATIAEKNEDIDKTTLDERSVEVGIGAVKYADLSTSRGRDYIFDVERMVSLQGNTGVYLQYANARIESILRRASAASASPKVDESITLEPAERRLALQLDEIGTVLASVAETYEPHRLAAYLYAVAQAFTDFYESCPVLKAPSDAIRANRLALCLLTSQTLELGLGLLGVAAPDHL